VLGEGVPGYSAAARAFLPPLAQEGRACAVVAW
jgi:hypothetical protein